MPDSIPENLVLIILRALVEPWHVSTQDPSKKEASLSPLAMLALAHADWARCILRNLTVILNVPTNGHDEVLFTDSEKLMVSMTIRMSPAEFVKMITIAVEEAKQERAKNWYVVWLETIDSEQSLGEAAGKLLQYKHWTPELLADLTDVVVGTFDNIEDAGLQGQDVALITKGVVTRKQAQLDAKCGADCCRTTIAETAIRRIAEGIALGPQPMRSLRLTGSPDDHDDCRAKVKAFFLLNIYGNFIDEASFSKDAATKLAFIARKIKLCAADFMVLLDMLAQEELELLEWEPEHMIASPFDWSLTLLRAWAKETDFSNWAGHDKNALLQGNLSALEYLRRCFEFYWRVDENAVFETDAAASLANALGTTLGLLPCSVKDVASIVGSFISTEEAWRREIVENCCFPSDMLCHVYSAVFVAAWALAAKFPASYSVNDCGKIAWELRNWPSWFRDAAASFVLKLVADDGGGALAPGMAKLVDVWRTA